MHYNLKFITNMKLTQGFGQLNQSSSLSQTLNGALNSGINMSSAMSSGTYQHYGLNALGTEQNKSLRHLRRIINNLSPQVWCLISCLSARDFSC